MGEKDKLNLEAIAKECNLFATSDINSVIARITELDEKYESSDLVKIYNYFLTVCKSPEILMNIIALADRYRDQTTLSELLDLLLMKNNDDSLKKTS